MSQETIQHRELKRLAVEWLRRMGCSAVATEVRCPISRWRVDVAGWFDGGEHDRRRADGPELRRAHGVFGARIRGIAPGSEAPEGAPAGGVSQRAHAGLRREPRAHGRRLHRGDGREARGGGGRDEGGPGGGRGGAVSTCNSRGLAIVTAQERRLSLTLGRRSPVGRQGTPTSPAARARPLSGGQFNLCWCVWMLGVSGVPT